MSTDHRSDQAPPVVCPRRGMVTRRDFLRLVGMAGGASIILAACQSQPAPAPPKAPAPGPAGAAPPAPAPPTAAPAAPAAPAKSSTPKVLRIAVPTEPTQLDPQNFSESIADSVVTHVYNRPYKFSRDLVPGPELAESAQVGADGTTWTIKLKKGIKFHDGTPFNAAAIKLIVDNSLGQNPPIRAQFVGRADLESATVIDDATVQIKTKYPLGPFLNNLSGTAWAVNSPAAFDKWGKDASKHPVGTGPYVFTEWKSGEQIVLERNTQYWGKQPFYDRLIWRFVPEAATRLALLETGDVDLVVDVPVSEMARLQQNTKLTVDTVKLNRVIYIAINTQRQYLSDKRVRQAMNYAVDKQAIIKGILKGLGREADSPVPALTWGYARAGQYAFDPAKAKQLLADAGVPKGHKVKLWVPQGRYPGDKDVGAAVTNYLREVGLDIDFQVMEWGTFLASIRKPLAEAQHDLYLLGWAATTMDADLGISGVLHSSQWPLAGANRGFYKSQAVDDLLIKGRQTVDPQQRKAVYAEVQKAIWEDAPWINLYDAQNILVYRKGITGVYMWPTEPLDLLEAKE